MLEPKQRYDARRAKILRAGSMIFAEKGYDGTGPAETCRSSG